jgi:LmbE family N-acetylglucosaminyl deacetylase
MFFLPTLTTLNNAVTQKHTGPFSINSSSSCSPVPVPVPPTPTNRLFILCLSNGNYDNLGSVRERELRAAADIISNCDNTGGSDNDSGSGSENNTTKYLNNPIKVTTVNDERLQDGPEESWDPDIIANTIHDFISNENLEQESVVLMTFDEGGVSGHINHVHTYKGVLHYYHRRRREDLHRHRKNRIHQDNQRDAAASYSDSELHVDAIHMTLWTLKSVRNPIIKYVPLMILL